jgi:hypothetical protein
MHAIVWGVTLGQEPTCDILFPKGDEDLDHMVVRVVLPVAANTPAEAWRTARELIDQASIEQFAEWRAISLPVDRTLNQSVMSREQLGHRF